MQFVIKRLMSSAELSICASLMAESSPWDKLYFSKKQCEAELARPGISTHAAVEHDGTMLGFLAAVANGIGFEPMIEYVCVEPNSRGKGIGTKLIAYFEEEVFPNADNLYLFVSDISPSAMSLYVRLGYAQVGALPNFNLEMQTEFLMRKTRRPRQAARIVEQQKANPDTSM